jgi:hypothetical protein
VCKDIQISADENCQATISAEFVDNGSYDPDEEPISLSIDNIGPFSIGEHFVNLTVTDEHEESDTCQAKVTVFDTAPPLPDVTNLHAVTGECGVDITSIPTAMDNCAGSIMGTTNDPLIYKYQGIYSVTWTYNDRNGNSTVQTQTVIVKDITAPTIESLSANPNVLWPPNHKMVQITINAVVTNNCDANPKTKILSVTSSETDDGGTVPDWIITGDLTVNLRAKRSGSGNERIYTITVKSTDASGNSLTQSVSVTVLKSKANK